MSDAEYERPAHWTDDDVLKDLHARWHDQPGNLIGAVECEWDGCEFWDAAKFVADTVGLATTGGETEWEERLVPKLDSSNTPYGLAYERRRKAGPWVPVDPTSPETTEEESSNG